jgi:type II secretory pathway pseudopilin PulG
MQRIAPPSFLTRQHGVVMIIALILLMVVSMLSVFTIRQATSSTQVSNNARTQTTAMQAAQMVLQECETRVRNGLDGNTPSISPDPATPPATPPTAQLWQPNAAGEMPNWDGQTSLAHFPAVPPANHYTLIMNAAPAGTMLQRTPECMVERQLNNNQIIIITARGFGPEVPAVDATRSAPQGTEVWLQSFLEIIQ